MNYNQQKRAVVEALLPLCPFLAVDGTHPGMLLPPDLHVADLVLRIGSTPTVIDVPQLIFTDEAWTGVISQHGRLSTIIVPWTAVSRLWIGPPFEGPVVLWPDAAQVPLPPKPPKLGLVHSVREPLEPPAPLEPFPGKSA